jgi:hypothetical protein
MSAPLPPPPYGGGWTPPPPKARRRRPSAWWFALGGAFIAASIASVAVGLVFFLSSVTGFLQVDATVANDGRPHDVSVPTDGRRMLWADGGVADCEIVDTETGSAVTTSTVTGSFERSDSSGDWIGVARFDPGSGHLEVTCTAAGGRVQIGPAPKIAHFVLGLVVLVFVPVILGLIGLVALIITGVLWATGRPRHEDDPADGVIDRR